jgi:high affinity Mn2+ porin
MRKLRVAGIALMAVAVASRTNAGDSSLPIPVKAPPIPAVYDWSGFYAGGRVGYAWGNSNWTASTPAAANVSGSLDLFQPLDVFKDTGSFSQGLQAGYNYMLPNRIVVGAEADVTFPGVPNNAGVSIGGISNLTSPTLGAVTFSETVLTSGTVRGRIGYASGSWLFYATGGLTWTYDRQTLTQFAIGASEQPFLWRLGFAAGAGIEVPIAPHWTRAARISVHRLRQQRHNVFRRRTADRFQFRAARAARRRSTRPGISAAQGAHMHASSALKLPKTPTQFPEDR